MNKIFSILLLFFTFSPIAISVAEAAKGDLPQEVEEIGNKADEGTAKAVKFALVISAGLAFIAVIIPGTRRLGWVLVGGIATSLMLIFLFTDYLSTPMSSVTKNKKMSDYFKEGK